MKCPVCDSTRLTPETETGPYKTAYRSSFRAGKKLVVAQIARGMICGDCGYVMLFAAPKELQKLHAVWEQLQPNER